MLVVTECLIYYTETESTSEDNDSSDSVSLGSKVRVVSSTVLHSHNTFLPTMQVHLQPSEGRSDVYTVKGEYRVNTLWWKEVESTVHNPSLLLPAAEAALDDLCWVPFGFQSQSFRPETEELCLQPLAGNIVGEEEETILLEVPPGAVSSLESVEIRSAVIPDGPFMLPEGYQLGSMVVYIYYDGQRVIRSLRLRLPHWYGGEDHIKDGLAFAMAPHTLKAGEHVYHFELLEGGRRLSSHCGELEIDGHCSLFAEVFKEGAISRYQAISLQRERGSETTCDVAITYASPLWCDVSTYVL